MQVKFEHAKLVRFIVIWDRIEFANEVIIGLAAETLSFWMSRPTQRTMNATEKKFLNIFVFFLFWKIIFYSWKLFFIFYYRQFQMIFKPVKNQFKNQLKGLHKIVVLLLKKLLLFSSLLHWKIQWFTFFNLISK